VSNGSVASSTPKVVVLLATLNGQPFLADQIRSVLEQRDVDVSVVVSDDGSNDGTWEYLNELAASDPRIHLLEQIAPSGSHAANFYRLLRDADLTDVDAIAFCDQDDLWLPGRLADSAAIIMNNRADGVSSDVEAFDESGEVHLVKKSYPQRRYDFLFESPGPGATMTLSPRLARLVREELESPDSSANQMEFHDWLVYGICRAHNWPWVIRDVVTVRYRQHANNALGANHGVDQGRRRLALIRQGWHRQQAVTLARVARDVDPVHRDQWDKILALLESRQLRQRLSLARRSAQLRRRPRDRWVMAVLIVAGLW
jgi:rhamnosyltransferase